MKPLIERSQYVDYMTGKQVPARDFNNGASDIFYDYVWQDVLKGHAGRQGSFDIEGFEGDVYYTKSRPIELKSEEAVHLAEVRPLKTGITRTVEAFDNAFEGMRITSIREELANMV